MASLDPNLRTFVGPAGTTVVDACTRNVRPRVRGVRRCGLMVGVELDESGIAANGAVTPARRIANELYDHGHFTRPIGPAIQLVPPLFAKLDELQSFVDALVATLDAGAR